MDLDDHGSFYGSIRWCAIAAKSKENPQACTDILVYHHGPISRRLNFLLLEVVRLINGSEKVTIYTTARRVVPMAVRHVEANCHAIRTSFGAQYISIIDGLLSQP